MEKWTYIFSESSPFKIQKDSKPFQLKYWYKWTVNCLLSKTLCVVYSTKEYVIFGFPAQKIGAKPEFVSCSLFKHNNNTSHGVCMEVVVNLKALGSSIVLYRFFARRASKVKIFVYQGRKSADDHLSLICDDFSAHRERNHISEAMWLMYRRCLSLGIEIKILLMFFWFYPPVLRFPFFVTKERE